MPHEKNYSEIAPIPAYARSVKLFEQYFTFCNPAFTQILLNPVSKLTRPLVITLEYKDVCLNEVSL
jgi:hypothetical protein